VSRVIVNQLAQRIRIGVLTSLKDNETLGSRNDLVVRGIDAHFAVTVNRLARKRSLKDIIVARRLSSRLYFER
jgi:hypothetical protein